MQNYRTKHQLNVITAKNKREQKKISKPNRSTTDADEGDEKECSDDEESHSGSEQSHSEEEEQEDEVIEQTQPDRLLNNEKYDIMSAAEKKIMEEQARYIQSKTPKSPTSPHKRNRSNLEKSPKRTPLSPVGQLNTGVDGGAISDDCEINSWEDELTEEDNSQGEDDYDEEDYGEEEVAPTELDANGNPIEQDDDYMSPSKMKLIINVACTEYDVIKKVAKKVIGLKLREYQEDHDGAIRHGMNNQKLSKEWDISWHDLSIAADFLSKMHPFQKINHYPGMYVVTRKNHLARNLMRMRRCFPTEFDFAPPTWVLPGDNIDFRNQFNNNSKQTFIVKPDGLSQGKGIFLSRNFDTIMASIEDGQQNEGIGGYVVQTYLDNPHTVDDLKYDLRIYVLLYGVSPLRVYIHHEGMARFCTEPYVKPNRKNMDNLFMHLTNYAINKHSDKYEEAEEESSEAEECGHKRSLNAILKILEGDGADRKKLWFQIKDIVIKTLTVGQPYISHLYRSCQPENLDNAMCFQILGFDIMIDDKFKPWLIEVNQSPSFRTDSPLDYRIKKTVLTDTFRLLNLSWEKRKKIVNEQKKNMKARILTGKQSKIDPEEKARIKQEKLQERFEYEKKRCGHFELIYPGPDEDRNNLYNSFLTKANDLWDEFTTGKQKRQAIEEKKNNKFQKTSGGTISKSNVNHNSRKELRQQNSNKNSIEALKPVRSSNGFLNRDSQYNTSGPIAHGQKQPKPNYSVVELPAGVSQHIIIQPSQVEKINAQTLYHERSTDQMLGQHSTPRGPQVQSAENLSPIDQAESHFESSPTMPMHELQQKAIRKQNYAMQVQSNEARHKGPIREAAPSEFKINVGYHQNRLQEADGVLKHLQQLAAPSSHRQKNNQNIKNESPRGSPLTLHDKGCISHNKMKMNIANTVGKLKYELTQQGGSPMNFMQVCDLMTKGDQIMSPLKRDVSLNRECDTERQNLVHSEQRMSSLKHEKKIQLEKTATPDMTKNIFASLNTKHQMPLEKTTANFAEYVAKQELIKHATTVPQQKKEKVESVLGNAYDPAKQQQIIPPGQLVQATGYTAGQINLVTYNQQVLGSPIKNVPSVEPNTDVKKGIKASPFQNQMLIQANSMCSTETKKDPKFSQQPPSAQDNLRNSYNTQQQQYLKSIGCVGVMNSTGPSSIEPPSNTHEISAKLTDSNEFSKSNKVQQRQSFFQYHQIPIVSNTPVQSMNNDNIASMHEVVNQHRPYIHKQHRGQSIKPATIPNQIFAERNQRRRKTNQPGIIQQERQLETPKSDQKKLPGLNGNCNFSTRNSHQVPQSSKIESKKALQYQQKSEPPNHNIGRSMSTFSNTDEFVSNQYIRRPLGAAGNQQVGLQQNKKQIRQQQNVNQYSQVAPHFVQGAIPGNLVTGTTIHSTQSPNSHKPKTLTNFVQTKQSNKISVVGGGNNNRQQLGRAIGQGRSVGVYNVPQVQMRIPSNFIITSQNGQSTQMQQYSTSKKLNQNIINASQNYSGGFDVDVQKNQNTVRQSLSQRKWTEKMNSADQVYEENMKIENIDAQNRRAISRQSAEFKNHKGQSSNTKKRIIGVPTNRQNADHFNKNPHLPINPMSKGNSHHNTNNLKIPSATTKTGSGTSQDLSGFENMKKQKT